MTELSAKQASVLNLPKRFPVLGTQISALRFQQTLEIIDSWIKEGQKHYVNVCTTHTTLECYDAPEMQEIVNHSGLATPDGMPLVWIGRLFGHEVERVYGPDLMLALCEQGQARNYRHFLYGGAEGVPEFLAAKLRERFPAIQIVGTYSPPFRALSAEEEAEVVSMIDQSEADIVWVGLGTPKQDYWVGRFHERLQSPVLIAVGAAFDFHAGRIKQAPKWMQRNGLEWLFRLTQDPKRLWKRYLLGNPRFVALFFKQLLLRGLQPNKRG